MFKVYGFHLQMQPSTANLLNAQKGQCKMLIKMVNNMISSRKFSFVPLVMWLIFELLECHHEKRSRFSRILKGYVIFFLNKKTLLMALFRKSRETSPSKE